MDLDLAHIRSLLAVVDFGGFHRAADALHLSQPVSQHVRRLEAQLGGPLFARHGRGVELTARGEAVASELRAVTTAHDRALIRLLRGATGPDRAPFMLGTVEHLVDPLLPDVLSVVRDHLDGRPVQLHVDRSRALVDRLHAGELDAAIVMDPHPAADPLELGSVPLHWWASAQLAAAPLPNPLPLVAYQAPCGLRELARHRLNAVGLSTILGAESPHLTGIYAAARAGLGVALLVNGTDGLRRLDHGPLAQPLAARLWLVAPTQHRHLAAPLGHALAASTDRGRRKPRLPVPA